MAEYTPKLNLLKKDPVVDGNDTFNIQTMLNDNWDKIDDFARVIEEGLGNVDDVGQAVGELIEQIGNLEELDTETKANLIDAINEIYQDLAAHKAENVYKIVVITEPAEQLTTTTVNFGFKPQLVKVSAVILNTIYESEGVSDRETSHVKYRIKSTDILTIQTISGVLVRFDDSINNNLSGTVNFTETGITIDWTLTGELSNLPGNAFRRYIIEAYTHGGD